MNRRDALIAAALFLLFSVGGWCFLTGFGLKPGQQFGDDRPMFTPAIGVAAGMGYYHPALDAPGVTEFISGDIPSLNLTPLRDPALYVPATGKFDLDRVYLLTAIGWLWRLFGVSWQIAWLLPAFCFGLCAAATYGLFRLATSPPLAIFAVFVTLVSPAYLDVLPGIRDFCKAPFVLFSLLFCGLLIRTALPPRSLLLLSALAGAFIGVGVGFRQDAIICLPPVLGCLLFAARAPLKHKALAMALASLAFLLPAWPVLRMNAETGGNNSFYLIQGFSQSSYADLGLRPASYTPLYSHSDQVVHAYICAFSEAERHDFPAQHRIHHAANMISGMALAQAMPIHPGIVVPAFVPLQKFIIWSNGAEAIARRQVEMLYTTFPADVLTRAYGSVLALVRGAVPPNVRDESYRALLELLIKIRAPLLSPLVYLGFPFAMFSFALIACRSPWRAFLALAVTLYFLGYPSLSYQPRHVFHLTFACWWFPIFLVHQSLGLPRLVREHGVAGLLGRLPMPLARSGVFLAAIAVCMGGPLYAARWWQAGSVDALVERYRAADLEPVPISPHVEAGGNLLYRPEPNALFKEVQAWSFDDVFSLRPDPGISPEYLVADIESDSPNVFAVIRYKNAGAFLDGVQAYAAPIGQGPVRLRMFFPAFGFSQRLLASEPTALSPFDGLELGVGATLKQLYRVKNKEDFPLMMTVWLPEDSALVEPAYRLRLWPDSVH